MEHPSRPVAWQTFEAAGTARRLANQDGLQRISRFRKAVSTASSLPALQTNLDAISAPPLTPSDQAMGLPALRSSLLEQLDTAERQARLKGQNPSLTPALLQSSINVTVVALGLAWAFAAAASGKVI